MCLGDSADRGGSLRVSVHDGLCVGIQARGSGLPPAYDVNAVDSPVGERYRIGIQSRPLPEHVVSVRLVYSAPFPLVSMAPAMSARVEFSPLTPNSTIAWAPVPVTVLHRISRCLLMSLFVLAFWDRGESSLSLGSIADPQEKCSCDVYARLVSTGS